MNYCELDLRPNALHVVAIYYIQCKCFLKSEHWAKRRWENFPVENEFET